MRALRLSFQDKVEGFSPPLPRLELIFSRGVGGNLPIQHRSRSFITSGGGKGRHALLSL